MSSSTRRQRQERDNEHISNTQQQQAKNSYWQNELDSLGIEPKQKNELNDNKEELENLADIVKQAMFQDYKVAYSEEGDAHKEEAESTVTVG
jgi:predicted flavoprotein YhiN